MDRAARRTGLNQEQREGYLVQANRFRSLARRAAELAAEPREKDFRELAAEMDRAARRKGLSQEEREDCSSGQIISGCWQEGPRSGHMIGAQRLGQICMSSSPSAPWFSALSTALLCLSSIGAAVATPARIIIPAVRPPRIAVSCSSVKGTRPPPRSRGISMKRGFVRAAISRASLSFTQSGPGCCVLGKPYLLR